MPGLSADFAFELHEFGEHLMVPSAAAAEFGPELVEDSERTLLEDGQRVLALVSRLELSKRDGLAAVHDLHDPELEARAMLGRKGARGRWHSDCYRKPGARNPESRAIELRMRAK